ncbi:hypothetical protein RHECNPAF_511003 [Rhizobium etli CNPAF512]|nr:hypothetical protein RHECNPAF_511003 [Rhizobium etli CNPAF512]
MFDAIVLQRLENDLRPRHPIACRLIVRAHLSVPFDAGICVCGRKPEIRAQKKAPEEPVI